MYEKKIIPCMLNRWFKNSFWDVLRILFFFFNFVVTECLSLLIFSNFFYLLNSLRGIHIFLIIMKKRMITKYDIHWFGENCPDPSRSSHWTIKKICDLVAVIYLLIRINLFVHMKTIVLPQKVKGGKKKKQK